MLYTVVTDQGAFDIGEQSSDEQAQTYAYSVFGGLGIQAVVPQLTTTVDVSAPLPTQSKLLLALGVVAVLLVFQGKPHYGKR
jgi:hypothetical protein